MENITEDVAQIKDKVESLDQGVVMKWLTSLVPTILSFALCVVLAIVVYIIGIKILKLIRRMINKGLSAKNTDLGVMQFIDQVIRITGYVVLIVIILNLFGIQTSSVAAAIASLGLTAGLALQGSLSNFAGGVLILMLKPFVVGDYIIEHTHGNEGKVAEITIFYTKLNTVDNRVVVIPNGTLANSSLTNETKNEARFLDLVFSISYQDDIKKAKEVLEQVLSTEEARVADREYKVFVKELGESSVNLGMRFWIPTEQYWPVRWRTLERVKISFDEAGITIPFQTLEVNVHKKPEDLGQ